MESNLKMKYLYNVRVYNHVHQFWDEYTVWATDKEDAAYEVNKRLDEETDEGAKGYLFYNIDRISDGILV